MGSDFSALAALPGMPSVPTIRKLVDLHPDFPLIERGSQGRRYVFDLEEAARFIRLRWPHGKPDSARIGDFAALLAQPGMPSLRVLRSLIADPAFPVLARGQRGQRYAFDLERAAAFVRQRLAAPGRVAPAQLALPLPILPPPDAQNCAAGGEPSNLDAMERHDAHCD